MGKGTYIVIEGGDGTGKSTQIALLEAHLKQQGHAVVEFHEPGGSPISDKLRTIIKDGSLDRTGLTNVLLFTAARREAWLQQALPALNQGAYVIASRNYFSTIAYQVIGEGLDGLHDQDEAISYIETIARTAADDRYMRPDHAIILSMDDEATRTSRINQRTTPLAPDTFETKDEAFQRRVHTGYQKIAEQYDVPIVNASQTIPEVADEIRQLLDI